jgi:signal transduction histidine kinase
LTLFAISSITFFAGQELISILVAATTLASLVYVSFTLYLPDIRQIARRGVSLFVSLMIAGLIYSGLAWLLLVNRSLLSGSAIPLTAILVGISIALLLNPLLNKLQRWLYRIVNGDQRNAGELLSDYSKNIANILDLNRLAGIISQFVTEAVEAKSVSLILIDSYQEEEKYCFIKVNPETADEKISEVGSIAFDSPIASSLSRERLPLTQYDIDLSPKFKNTPTQDRILLSSLEMDVILPIYLQERWIGLIVLGPKVSGDRFFKQELDILGSIANQTAVALENARLYENVNQRNLENEKLNIQLSKANQELFRLDKAKSDFISIASHELRTPLTQILGYNDILGDMVESGSVPRSMGLQMVESVRKAARRLEEIVETLFDVSKLDTNSLEFNKTPTSIPLVIAAAIDKWSKALEERKINISVKGMNSLPQVTADGNRLTQVFSHLVQNANKSTPDGGQIRISGKSFEEGDEKKKFVEIIVADTGIGISSEDLERIFEKFYRVGNIMLHSTGDTKFKGAGPGLGLTIARGIVEAHQGRIWAESSGHDEIALPGAKLHVLLPASDEALSTSIYPFSE